MSNTKIFWEIYIFSLEDENYDDDFKEFISQININIIPLSIINYFNKFNNDFKKFSKFYVDKLLDRFNELVELKSQKIDI